MGRVPRERFVPLEQVAAAFEDRPLPLSRGQTISQPAMVAMMAEAALIEASSRLLEIGTGSGYGSAVLRELSRHVTTIERIPELADGARARLAELGYDDVNVIVGDGTLGWATAAPYDAIIVTAYAAEPPAALLNQLAPRGRLIIPIGARDRQQHLECITRKQPTGTRKQPSGASRDPGREGSAVAEAGAGVAGSALFRRERLTGVRFVPLIGEQGFPG